MKKFRGKRRYFRNMWQEIADTTINIDDWYAFSHTHLDFNGYGITSGKLRRTHIKGHLALLDKTVAQFEQGEKPYQAWLTLNETHPEYDAVYEHTNNPYDEFPFTVTNACETTDVPMLYRDLIDTTKYKIVVSHSYDQLCYTLQIKGKGVPLHTT